MGIRLGLGGLQALTLNAGAIESGTYFGLSSQFSFLSTGRIFILRTGIVRDVASFSVPVPPSTVGLTVLRGNIATIEMLAGQGGREFVLTFWHEIIHIGIERGSSSLATTLKALGSGSVAQERQIDILAIKIFNAVGAPTRKNVRKILIDFFGA